jgi:DNA-binding transcriptional LysR family regulator
MQEHNWNDLRYLLALHRTGSLKDAGRSVGTSETTIARRIRSFERVLGTTLFIRTTTGKYEATDTGLAIIDHAEAVEQENIAIWERVGDIAERLTGVVRISSVPIIVNRLLVPNLAYLVQRHPNLTIELVPDSRNVDLTQREADLAIRFSRPTMGGYQTKAQKLGVLGFGAFGPSTASLEEIGALGWIAYDEAHAGLPQARWLALTLASTEVTRAPLRVSDAETALEAVACGLGKTILPISVARADRRLRGIPTDGAPPPPVRDVWLLSHVHQSVRSSVTAVKNWLTELFRNAAT